MKLLLDTHSLIWWVGENDRLSKAAQDAIASPDNQVWVSAASAMEVSTKVRLGKLPEAMLLDQRFEAIVAEMGFISLPISIEHARQAGAYAIPHKDPFDRLLIVQSQIEDMLLVSNETVFDSFGVQRLW
jgi:PIN domain nuclease of toxin-antitoxin system